jgi:Divergent InlB B-repeat domain
MRGLRLQLCVLAAALTACECDPQLANSRALKLTAVGEGSVAFDPSPIKEQGGRAYFPRGSTVLITARPAAAGYFEGWEGACTGTELECVLKLDADATVTARFGVTVDVAIEGAGRVVSAPAAVDCTASCKRAFGYDLPVTLTATALAGFRFDGWAGDCGGTDTCALTTDVPHAVTARFVAAPTPCDWVKRFGGPYREGIGGLRRDALTGRLALVGTTQGNVNFGGGLIPATMPVSSNLFVAVLDPLGAYQSAFVKGRAGAVTLGDGVAWLPNGALAVSGAWSGLVDFGDGTVRDDGAAGFGLFRGFFATWAPDATLKSFQALGENTSLLSGFSGLHANPQTGATTVVGEFAAQESFGGPTPLLPRDFDAYAVQYEADGGFRWALQGGGPYYDHALGVHGLADGTTLVAGSISGAGEFLSASFDAGVSNGAFVVTLGADGALLGQDFISPLDVDGGSGADARAVAALPSGGVVVGGSYSGQVLANGVASGPALGAAPGYDGFVAKLGAQGWFRRVGGTLYDEVVAVAVDPVSEDVWVLGDFRGTVTFQSSPVTSAGSGDIFLMRFDKTGVLQSVRVMGGPGDDFGRSLQLDPFGRALVGGEFESTANFGVGNLTSAGDNDVFIGCFSP